MGSQYETSDEELEEIQRKMDELETWDQEIEGEPLGVVDELYESEDDEYGSQKDKDFPAIKNEDLGDTK